MAESLARIQPGTPNLAWWREGIRFGHPSEAEFAQILDFYGVRWEYEPRSFLLRTNPGSPSVIILAMIVDAHVHIFPPAAASHKQRFMGLDLTFRTLYASPKARTATVEELIAGMDAAGVDVSVVVNIGWGSQELCRETNDYLLDAAKAYPNRLIAFCGVNPAAKGAVEEIDRCAARGARGIGELHPDYQGYSLTDAEMMAPIMRAASKHRMVVLTHASEPVGHDYSGKGLVTPDVLYRFITSFPESRIILAHWGGGLPFYALMPEVRMSLSNVWFDTAVSPFLYEPTIFDRVAEIVGADKILFATDFPLIKAGKMLKQVEDSKMLLSDKGKLLGANAAALFGLKQHLAGT